MLYSGSHQPGKMADEPSKTISQVSVKRRIKALKGSFRWRATCGAAQSAPTIILRPGHAVVLVSITLDGLL